MDKAKFKPGGIVLTERETWLLQHPGELVLSADEIRRINELITKPETNGVAIVALREYKDIHKYGKKEKNAQGCNPNGAINKD